MHCQGFSLQQIANVTKHKNLDSLKHYVSGPTHDEKEEYNEGLFDYAQKQKEQPRPLAPKRSTPNGSENNENQEEIATAVKRSKNYDNESAININLQDQNIIEECWEICTQEQVQPLRANNYTQNVMNNQLRQAVNMFQNANFSNCTFTFSLPK